MCRGCRVWVTRVAGTAMDHSKCKCKENLDASGLSAALGWPRLVLSRHVACYALSSPSRQLLWPIRFAMSVLTCASNNWE